MNIANTPLQIGSSDAKVRSSLHGRTVGYLNMKSSTVQNSAARRLKILNIDKVDFSKTTGRRYIVAQVQDLDDGNAVKFRSLQLGGIAQIL